LVAFVSVEVEKQINMFKLHYMLVRNILAEMGKSFESAFLQTLFATIVGAELTRNDKNGGVTRNRVFWESVHDHAPVVARGQL
jgi:hypothetical protein